MAKGCVNLKVMKSTAIFSRENKEVLFKGGKMNIKKLSLKFISIISCLVFSLVAMPVSAAGAATVALQPEGIYFPGAPSDNSSMIRGTITSIDEDSITVSDNTTEVTLTINSNTKISLKDSESLTEGLSVTVRYNTETLVAASITEGSAGFPGGQRSQGDRGPGNENGNGSPGSSNGGPGSQEFAGGTMVRGTIASISSDSITVTSDEDSSSVTLTIDSNTRLPREGAGSFEEGDTVVVFYDSDTMIATSITAGKENVAAERPDDQNTDNQTRPDGRFGGNNGANGNQGARAMNGNSNNGSSDKMTAGGPGNNQQKRRFQGGPR